MLDARTQERKQAGRAPEFVSATTSGPEPALSVAAKIAAQVCLLVWEYKKFVLPE